MKLSRVLMAVGLCLLLASCHQSSKTYDYLMTHPDVLADERTRCEKTIEDCGDVNRAVMDFNNLEQVARSDPQAFGKKILSAQMEAASLSSQIQEMEKEPNVDPAALAPLKKTYQDDLQNIQILLSVSAVTDWG